jgi:hypothetical protein
MQSRVKLADVLASDNTPVHAVNSVMSVDYGVNSTLKGDEEDYMNNTI